MAPSTYTLADTFPHPFFSPIPARVLDSWGPSIKYSNSKPAAEVSQCFPHSPGDVATLRSVRFVARDGWDFPFFTKIFSGSVYRYIPPAWDMDDPKIPYNISLILAPLWKLHKSNTDATVSKALADTFLIFYLTHPVLSQRCQKLINTFNPKQLLRNT